MTDDEIKKRMDEITSLDAGGRGDTEAVHSMADSLLCEILFDEGYQDVFDWFNSLKKWYA